MKSFFKNIQLKPKKNKDISYDDELVNNLTIKTKSYYFSYFISIYR